MADQAVIAQRSPYVMEVGPGMVYWCRCGRSKTQPFCDAPIRERIFPRLKWSSKSDSGSHSVGASTPRSRPSATGPIHDSELIQPPELEVRNCHPEARNSLREFAEKLDSTGNEQ